MGQLSFSMTNYMKWTNKNKTTKINKASITKKQKKLQTKLLIGKFNKRNQKKNHATKRKTKQKLQDKKEDELAEGNVSWVGFNIFGKFYWIKLKNE